MVMTVKMTMLATKWVMRKIFFTCYRILQGLTVLRQVDVDLRKEELTSASPSSLFWLKIFTPP